MVNVIILFLLFVLLIFISIVINRLFKNKISNIHIRVGYLIVLFGVYGFWYVDNYLGTLKSNLLNIFILYFIPVYALTLGIQVLNRKE